MAKNHLIHGRFLTFNSSYTLHSQFNIACLPHKVSCGMTSDLGAANCQTGAVVSVPEAPFSYDQS